MTASTPRRAALLVPTVVALALAGAVAPASADEIPPLIPTCVIVEADLTTLGYEPEVSVCRP